MAWAALNARFDAHTQEARRACHKELFTLTHVAGGDPVDFFSKRCKLKLRLETLGEKVSDEVYLDIILSGLTSAPKFHFIRETHYRNESTSVDCLQDTANRFFVDQQSRKAAGPAVWGRGAAMAASSIDQCHRCKEFGHFPARLSEICAAVPTDEREEARQEARKWGKWTVQVVLLSPHEDAQRC